MSWSHIPYGRHWITQDDIDAVSETLASDWLTTGPKVSEFEHCLADGCGARYVVALNSGTSALHGAYFAAGLGPGRSVVTSPLTFAATATAALYLGAEVQFADIGPDWNIDPAQVAALLGQQTRVVAPVDFAGLPADIEAVSRLAHQNGAVVVEDAAHALGATYRGRPVGSISDMTIFSFHPVKHVTTCEGGAVATNDPALAEALRAFRSHGIVKDDSTAIHGGWYYEQRFLGYNYRLSDVHAALGISQMKRLGSFLERRRALAVRYLEAFASWPDLNCQALCDDRTSAWHLFVIQLTDATKRRRVYDALHERNIGVQVHYMPVYWHPLYQARGFQKGLCPKAEDFYARSLSLPLYPSMSDEEQDYVVAQLRQVLDELA